MNKYLLVMVGGGLGSLARYVLSTEINNRILGRFPIGTIAVNVTGSFLIGLLMVLLTEGFQLNPNWRLLLVVGFLGGYTTFSTFEFETLQLLQSGRPLLAILYVSSSVTIGLLAVWGGAALARRLLL